MGLLRFPAYRTPYNSTRSRPQRFLLELAEQQARVGGALEAGARLLAGGALAREEAAEVRLQMRLLNARWEALRLRALRRQAAGHDALMRAQLARLADFRRWLTLTEDRMSRLRGGARARLRQVAALRDDLARRRPLVDALADCVVVVDDDAAPDAGTRSTSSPLYLIH